MTQLKVLAGILVSAIVLAILASAASAGLGDLKKCSFLRDGITRSDASLLLTGITETDCGYTQPSADRSTTLIQLRADGNVDESRPDEGVTVLDPGAGEPVDLVNMGGDRTMLVTENRLMLLNSNGRKVAGFGDSGVREVTDLGFGGSRPILGATPTGDGGVAIVGGSSFNGLRLAKLDFRGNPDPSFGTAGIATPVLLPDRRFHGIGAMTVDSERRLVVGGVGPREPSGDAAAALRLNPDGSLDTTFGPGGDGLALVAVGECSDCVFWEITNIRIGPDDSVHLFGVYQQYTYSMPPILFALDSDGNPAGGGPGATTQCPRRGISRDMSAGGLTLITGIPGRGDLPAFSATFCAGDGAPAREYISQGLGTARTGFFSPGGRTAFVLTGGMQIVKLDTTGARPVSSFGRSGIATVNPEACRYGEAAPLTDPDGLLLQRCRIKPPAFRSSFVLGGAGTRRPVLKGKVEMTGTPEQPGFMIQKISVRLPRGVRIRNGAASRQIRQSSDNGEGVTRVSRSRKLLTLEFAPDFDNFDPLYWESEQLNVPLAIRVDLKRGDLARIPARLRRRPLRVKVTARYEPTYGSRTLGPNWKTMNRKAVRKSGRPGRR